MSYQSCVRARSLKYSDVFGTSSSWGLFERQSELSELISLSRLDLSLIVGCEPSSETKQKAIQAVLTFIASHWYQSRPKGFAAMPLLDAFGNMPNISQHAVFLMHCMKFITILQLYTIIYNYTIEISYNIIQPFLIKGLQGQSLHSCSVGVKSNSPQLAKPAVRPFDSP